MGSFLSVNDQGAGPMTTLFMNTSRNPRTILLLCGIVMMTTASAWTKIDSKERSLYVSSPSFEGINPRIRISKDMLFGGRAEWLHWGSFGRGDNFSITRQTAGDSAGFGFMRVEDWLEELTPIKELNYLGSRYELKQNYGEFEVRRFSALLGNIKKACYAFRAAIDGDHEFVAGFYCKKPGERASDDEIRDLIASITVGKPSTRQDSRQTLGAAIIAGDVETAKKLLSAGADPNAEVSFTRPDWNRGREWDTRVLVAAIVYRHSEIVEALLKRGVSFKLRHNAFAICPAVNSGQTEIVAALIKAGIEINPGFGCIRGFTPLESAERRSNREIVDLLLKAGAR